MLERRVPSAICYNDAHGLPGLAGPGDSAYTYDRYDRLDSAGIAWRRRRYAASTGRLLLEIYSSGALPDEVLQGHSREWYESGQLREELTYQNDAIVGELRTYHPNGKLRRREVRGTGQPGTCYDADGRELAQCPPYHTFAQLPGLAGAFSNVYQRLQKRYTAYLPPSYRPARALSVYYAFRIDPTGRARNARIVTAYPGWTPAAVDDTLRGAILTAIEQLPAFVPATLDGYPESDWIEGLIAVPGR